MADSYGWESGIIFGPGRIREAVDDLFASDAVNYGLACYREVDSKFAG